MADLSRMIMNLNPDSLTRLSCIIEYKSCRAKAKAVRDTITNIDDRMLVKMKSAVR